METDNKISKKSFNTREELQAKINEVLSNRKRKTTRNVDDLKKEFNLNAISERTKHFTDVARASKTRNNSKFLNNTAGITEIKDLTKSINLFFEDDCSAYLVMGGIGDLLLVLACAYDQPKPKILFMANNPNFLFAKQLCDYFNVECLMHRNLMGTDWLPLIYNKFINMSCFKTSAHLPDGCNYGDWFNVEKYISRVRTKTNWSEKVGINRLFKEKYVVLAPCGSTKGESRRRYLSLEEYRVIVAKLLSKNFKVITTSDHSDIKTYGLFPNKNCLWLANDKIYSYDESKEEINLEKFLQIINSCDYCISMDTYLKTLVLLMDKEVSVIKTRYNGAYRDDESDASAKIFLNKDFWPKVKSLTLEDLISDIENF